MNSPLPIGLGAGLVSAVLFVSAASGNALSMLLLYLTPLPGLLAGLGWGWTSAGLAAISGTLVAGAALGFKVALSYVLSLGLPVTILCYLALLCREMPEPQPASNSPQPAVEWYPVGRLVAWTALIGGVLSALFVPTVAYDAEAYQAAIKNLLQNAFLNEVGGDASIDAEALDRLSTVFARFLPAIFAIVWIGVMVFNLWIAGRIVEHSGRALRPWPDVSSMAFPIALAIGFGAALLFSFLPGLLGIIASGFFGAFLCAYFLLGLVILHAITRPLPRRGVFLAMIYVGILLFGWIAILIAILGLSDPIFQLRERALNRNKPPTFGDD